MCVVIAGPNGAGKTIFARRYLSSIVKIENFVNARTFGNQEVPDWTRTTIPKTVPSAAAQP